MPQFTAFINKNRQLLHSSCKGSRSFKWSRTCPGFDECKTNFFWWQNHYIAASKAAYTSFIEMNVSSCKKRNYVLRSQLESTEVDTQSLLTRQPTLDKTNIYSSSKNVHWNILFYKCSTILQLKYILYWKNW